MGQFLYDILNSGSFNKKISHPATIDIKCLFSNKGIYVVSYTTGKTINKEPQYAEEKKRVVYAPKRHAALFLHSDTPQTIYDKPNFINAQLDTEEVTLLESILLKSKTPVYCHYSQTGDQTKLQLHGARELKAAEVSNAHYNTADRIVRDMLETQQSLNFWYSKLDAATTARKSKKNSLTEGMVKAAEHGIDLANNNYKQKAEQIIQLIK